MKTLFLMGAFALLTTTLFSCTADEYETAEKKNEINKPIPAENTAQGPDDDPVPVTPPKK
ncbi:hypothetical protein [Flavobacterium sp. RS13.1]|jgi:hypothetical protein|uniref:hypothetical protein n=1 Tax=Flavobacterium sp. RS13.1 TaxID=3400345 RepID=UPI003AAF07E9